MAERRDRPKTAAADFTLERLLEAGGKSARDAYKKIMYSVPEESAPGRKDSYGRRAIKPLPRGIANWRALPPSGNRETFRETLLYNLKDLYKLNVKEGEHESPWKLWRRWARAYSKLASEIEASRGTHLDPSAMIGDRLRQADQDDARRQIEDMLSRQADSVRYLRALAADLMELDRSAGNAPDPIRKREMYLVDVVEMATGAPHYSDVAALVITVEMLAKGQAREAERRLSKDAIYSRSRTLQARHMRHLRNSAAATKMTRK